MELNYASKGVAGAALGTGIAGLSLGVLNSGLFNGFGMGGNIAAAAPAAMEAFKTTIEAERGRTDDKMRIAQLEAEKYSDKSDIETYRQIRSEIVDLRDRLTGRIDGIAAQVGDQRVINQQLTDGVAMARQEFKAGLDMEAQKRQCADGKIILYANGTFQPKSIPNLVTTTEGTNGADAFALTSTTPAYRPLYNPLDD